MKKLITILLFLLLMTGCQSKQKEDIYILYTNDVHCNLEGDMNYATVASLKKKLISENKNVVLVDSGDFSQGKPIGSLTKGSAIIEIMNKVPYDIATIGNHEFDYGMEVLKNNLDSAEFEVVVSNISYSGKKENVFENIKPYVIKDFNGTKVAFIGVVTPQTLISATPKNFEEDGEYVYNFQTYIKGESLYKAIQENVDSARSEKADYVILLSHLGDSDLYFPYDSKSIIANTKGIDAILDGHEHATIIGELHPNLEGKDVLLTSTGSSLENIGQLIIKADGTIESMLISDVDEKDEEVQNFINEKTNTFNEYLNTVIGKSDFDLTVEEDGVRIVRNRESNMANLVADAYSWYFNADFAIVNGGGVRNSIKAGDITLADCLAVTPFSNELSFVKVTGQMIYDALEYTSRNTESYTCVDGNAVGENGTFLQVSNLKYTIDTSKNADFEIDENGMLKSISGERRISNVEILKGGEYVSVELDEIYTMSGSDHTIKQHGGGLTCFDDAEIIVQAGPSDIYVLAKYIKEELNGVIPEKYRNIEGRIIVK